MRNIGIPVSQGVNLSDPLSDLGRGELALARNCHYEPEKETLKCIPGRTSFGAIAAAVPAGLVYASFRTAGQFLIGGAGTTIASAPVGTTGAFTSIKTTPSPLGALEAVYYNGTDRVYLFDAVNTPQVWSGSGATRDMGLDSPTSAATLDIIANAQTTYRAPSTLQYCFTEYDSVNDVESGPSPVSAVQTTTTGDTIRITLPSKVNAAADTWKIYRTLDGGDVFFLLADIASTMLRYYDGEDTQGLGSSADNDDEYGFDTVTDIFLSARPALAMIGGPLSGNYITVNGTIPNGDILAVHEASLCVAGVPGYPQDVYYSMPDNPEQFSPIYFLREENRRGDPVSGMGVANDRLIVFTLNSIFRHDTLPRVTDPGFGLGSSRQLVTDDQGCVAKRTVTNFGVEDPNNRLFYLSSRGPFMTDGYQTMPLGIDLDWSERVINFNAIAGAVAVNFPKYFQIWLFLPSPSSSTNDMAFIYHYHPYHKKEATGLGKWSGPIDVRCNSAAVVHQENTETRMYLADTNSSGGVYLHDNGAADAQNNLDANGNIKWEWQTGHNPLSTNIGRHKRIHRVFVNVRGTDDFAPAMRYAVSQRDQQIPVHLANITTNTAGSMGIGTSQIEPLKTRTYRGGVHQVGTHIQFHMTETSSTQQREVVGLEVEVEDWGRQK